jgi:thiamine phosphate synthase YjbQ (UPF0047 family)
MAIVPVPQELGTRQSVMLVELDGPRERTVPMTLIPC